MSKGLQILILSFILISCKQKITDDVIHSIINESFLQIVDTIAYKAGKILPPPSESYNLNINSKLFICAEENFTEPKEMVLFLQKFYFNKDLDSTSYNIIPIEKFDLKKLNKTGRYILKYKSECSKLQLREAGNILFYKPILYKKSILLFSTLWSSEKAGLTVLLEFKKANSDWYLAQKFEVERW